MEYVKKFLHVEGIIGQGAFGRVLVTSPLQNQSLQPQQTLHLANGYNYPSSEGGDTAFIGLQSNYKTPTKDKKLPLIEQVRQQANELINSCDGKRSSLVKPNEKINNDGTKFALKCVHPILKPQRLASELRHLRDLGGQCNVVQMHTAHLHKGSLYIVMDLIEHSRFTDIVAQLDYSEIMEYMKNLLIALQHVHSRNIMHRDIKPANFLYDRKNKKFMLVDFGLAQQVRVRHALVDPWTNTTPLSNNYSNTTKLPASPKTPTTTNRRLNTSQELFPQTPESRRDLYGSKNPLEGHKLIGSPACRYFQLQTGAPETPNISTKRQLADSTDINSMLKKIKVSITPANQEPVKLTVGAYESPVTHNDSLGRQTMARNNKFSTPTVPYGRGSRARCDCRGKARTCSVCLSRPDSVAPKSGTPGFKAPELLLRYQFQNTAIDIWSAGVLFACLLSGHSPFFRDSDDATSLAEIITILGSQKVVQAAKSIGIRLTVKPEREPVDIVQLCKALRFNSKDKKKIEIPDNAFDLLKRMLDPNPQTRISASDALKHPWFENIVSWA